MYQSQAGIVQPLVAIVVPQSIDYGDLAQGDISQAQNVTVINAGNRNANISIKGWAQTEGDNYAMNCTFGHIPIQYEKYNISQVAYSSMSELTSTLDMIPDFYVPQRTDEGAESFNYTFWRLQIPIGAGGICTGKILFSASDLG